MRRVRRPRVLKRGLIVSRSATAKLEKLLMGYDFEIVETNPDFVVCYGGDGTILFAERKFPEVLKLVVKRSSICRKYDYTLYDVEDVLRKIRDQRFGIRKEMKLEAQLQQKKLIGLNEIQVHAKLPIYAVRFSVVVDGREFDGLIGDGIVVATPFGSTGYYKSTGGEQFTKGIGISFNNLHNKKIKSFVIPEDFTVTIHVNRGPAWIIADNNENFLEMKDNEVSVVRKSTSTANFIVVPK